MVFFSAVIFSDCIFSLTLLLILCLWFLQEFLRGSSQNVCAAGILDAVDALLDCLKAFRKGFPTAALGFPHPRKESTTASDRSSDGRSSPSLEGPEQPAQSASRETDDEPGEAAASMLA